MNVSLDLSPAQLSKLRNFKGVRITPAMVGRGVDLIIDPMTFNNMAKKLDKGKGAIITLGQEELNMNKMEGSGLYAGKGNESGKISRTKKAGKWLGFTKQALNDGMDLGERGLSIYQKAREKASPVGQIKSLFGWGNEMEGGNIFSDIKKGYNKNIKNTAVGSALRDTARSGLNKGYDVGSSALSNYQYTKPLGKLALNSKAKNVDKLMQLSGLGLFDDIKKGYNKNVKKTAIGSAVRDISRKGLNMGYDGATKLLENNQYTKPIATIGRNSKDANINRMMKMSGLGLRVSGNGLSMGGMCCGCGMQNDKFLFDGSAL
jgi:hypothetical protein